MKNLLFLALACLVLVQVTFASECSDAGGLCRKKKNCGCIDGQWKKNLDCDETKQKCCMPNPGVELADLCVYCPDVGGRCRDPANCDCDGGHEDSDFYCGQWAKKQKCCMPDAATDVSNWYACAWEYTSCLAAGGRCRNPDKCDCKDGYWDDEDNFDCWKEGEICCFPNPPIINDENWISCDWELRTCENNGGTCRNPDICDCNGGQFDITFGCGVHHPEWQCCMPGDPVDDPWIPCTWQNNLWCEDEGGLCRNPSKCDCLDGAYNYNGVYQCSVDGDICCFPNDPNVDFDTWIACDWQLRTCENNGGVCRDPTKCDCNNEGSFDSDFGCGVDHPEWECCMPDDPDDDSWISCTWQNNLWCEEEGGRCAKKSNCDCHEGSFEGYENLQCSGVGEECCFPNVGVDVDNWIYCDWQYRTCEGDDGKCRTMGPNCPCEGGYWDPVTTACGVKADAAKRCCIPDGSGDPFYPCNWEIPDPDQECLDVNGLCRDDTKCSCFGGSYDYNIQCGNEDFACCKPPVGESFPAGHIACPH